MKKFLISLSLVLAVAMPAFAATDMIPLDKAPNKLNDLSALQNGAKIFVNYCLNCHAAAYMRFNRLKDIGLTDKQIKDNLLFTTDKVGDTMKISMDAKQGKDWFGGNPPDLTVIARSALVLAEQVQTTSTPICAPTTATTPKPRVGTIWLSPTWVCPMCFGSCKGNVVPFTRQSSSMAIPSKWSRVGSKPLREK